MSFGAREVNSGQIHSRRTLDKSRPGTFHLPRLEHSTLPIGADRGVGDKAVVGPSTLGQIDAELQRIFVNGRSSGVAVQEFSMPPPVGCTP